MTIKLGLIGGGVMGEAIVSRLIIAQAYSANQILVSDPQPERREFLQKTYGVQTTNNNLTAAQALEVVILAIKPQIFPALVQELRTGLLQYSPSKSYPVLLSILAGVSLSKLTAAFPHHPIIRVMPNTPATVGAAMTALAPNQNVSPQQLALAKTIFQAVGEVVELPESLMDAVTGLSGSGPAYVALMVEALSDGGVAAGLPRAIASQLALQTVLGTATLLQETKIHPAELKDRVTSPGGTTIAGVAELERGGFRAAVINAVLAAYGRSQELGKS
jgi:pyrroline-5-carboxylate reductase